MKTEQRRENWAHSLSSGAGFPKAARFLPRPLACPQRPGPAQLPADLRPHRAHRRLRAGPQQLQGGGCPPSGRGREQVGVGGCPGPPDRTPACASPSPPTPQEDYYLTTERLWIPLRWAAPQLLGELHGTFMVVDPSRESNIW